MAEGGGLGGGVFFGGCRGGGSVPGVGGVFVIPEGVLTLGAVGAACEVPRVKRWGPLHGAVLCSWRERWRGGGGGWRCVPGFLPMLREAPSQTTIHSRTPFKVGASRSSSPSLPLSFGSLVDAQNTGVSLGFPRGLDRLAVSIYTL